MIAGLSHTTAATNQINKQQGPVTFVSLSVARNPWPAKNRSRKVNQPVLITSSPHEAELLDNKEKQEKKLEAKRNRVEMVKKKKAKKNELKLRRMLYKKRKPRQRAKQERKKKRIRVITSIP